MKELNLNLGGKKPMTITDDTGKSYTPSDAKRIYLTNDLNCNIAFSKLVEMDFDLDKVREYYDT